MGSDALEDELEVEEEVVGREEEGVEEEVAKKEGGSVVVVELSVVTKEDESSAVEEEAVAVGDAEGTASFAAPCVSGEVGARVEVGVDSLDEVDKLDDEEVTLGEEGALKMEEVGVAEGEVPRGSPIAA